jgi:hypothetical protein
MGTPYGEAFRSLFDGFVERGALDEDPRQWSSSVVAEWMALFRQWDGSQSAGGDYSI